MQYSAPPQPNLHTNVSESGRSKFVLVLLAVILVVALVPFAYTGTFARYQADDYCSAQLLRTDGFWGAQWASYIGWSNRFSTMLVTGLVDPMNVFGMQILPGLLIAGLLLSAFLLLLRLRFKLEIKIEGLAVFCLAGLTAFFALYTTPNPFQSYYWRSGSITYTLPVIFLMLLLSILLKNRKKTIAWWQAILIGLFSFFAAGFSETNAALQISLLILGLAGIALYERKTNLEIRSHAWWIAALIGAGAAVAVILLSPGNSVRMSMMPEPPGFFRWIYLSFRFAAGFVYNGLVGTILPRGVSFVLGFTLAFFYAWKDVKTKSVGWGLLVVPVSVFLLAAAICAPSAYAQSAYPEDRALTGATIILTAGVIIEGFLLGILAQIWWSKSPKSLIKLQRIMAALAIIILSGYVIYGGMQVLKGAADYQARAAAWDARAAQIEQLRQSGDLSPEVSALDSVKGVMELSDDPTMWVNRCAVTYYQVEQIFAK